MRSARVRNSDVPINGHACHQERLKPEKGNARAVPDRIRHWSEDSVSIVRSRQATTATYCAIMRCHEGVNVDAKVLEASHCSGI